MDKPKQQSRCQMGWVGLTPSLSPEFKLCKNMKRNLDMMGGLVCSEQIMLALIATGLSREEAYGVAQRNASKAWSGQNFREAIESDPTVKERLSAQDLEHAFDIEHHLKHLAHTFEVLKI